jgi:hypothetical protein
LLLLAVGAGCASFDAPVWSPASRSWYYPSSAEWAAMEKCLAEFGLNLESRFAPNGGTEMQRATITVRQKLRELRAYCKGGRLYDEAGRELYFYQVPEYGPPPTQGMLDADRERYENLRKRYRLIEMYRAQAPC